MSCDVKRAFSQWVAIQNTGGKQLKKPVVAGRMFSCVNGKYLDDIRAKTGDRNAELANVQTEEIDEDEVSVDEMDTSGH